MSDLWIVAISFSDINLETHAVFWLSGKLGSGVFYCHESLIYAWLE